MARKSNSKNQDMPDVGVRIGRRTPKINAASFVTGRAAFASDVSLPNMAHVRFVRSKIANGDAVRLDPRAASAVEGVLAVILPEEMDSFKIGGALPVLTAAPRYFGEELAAVCAVTDAAARQAAASFSVDYRTTPAVSRLEDAAEDLAPPAVAKRGDPDRALAVAAAVFKRTYRVPAQSPAPLEPHVVVAQFTRGELTIHESTQAPFVVREQISRRLDLPLERVRVMGLPAGGGFGSKLSAGKHTLLAAYLAMKLERPVKVMLDLGDEPFYPGGRPEAVVTLTAGVDDKNRLTALVAETAIAAGPYEYGVDWFLPDEIFLGQYACANVRVTTRRVKTNTPPPSPLRGMGSVVAAAAIERMMDEIAAARGVDPAEFRLANLPSRNPASGEPYLTPDRANSLAACVRKGVEAFDWVNARMRAQQQNFALNELRADVKKRWKYQEQLLRGVGMAISVWDGAGGPPAPAVMRVFTDGTAVIEVGASEIGTETETAFALIASERTGIPPENIRVVMGDTAVAGYTLPSCASRTLASLGPAVDEAAQHCAQQLRELAARTLAVNERKVELSGGSAIVKGKSTPLADILRQAGVRELTGHGARAENPRGAIHATTAVFAEASVDTVTGQVRVEKLLAVQDSGRVIHPAGFENQLTGGMAMGLGLALFEDRVFDPAGAQPLNSDWSRYRMPTASDVPADIAGVSAQVGYTGNSIGAKGVGECGMIPAAPAIANAVAHAIGSFDAAWPLSGSSALEQIIRSES